MTEFVYVPVQVDRLVEVYRLLSTISTEIVEIADDSPQPAPQPAPITRADGFRYPCAPERLERAKTAIKRLPQPFAMVDLERAVGFGGSSLYGAVERMIAQGWLRDEGYSARGKGRRKARVRLMRYLPAPDVPLAKREDDPAVTGRRATNGGGGATGAPVPHTGRRETPRGEIGRLVNTIRQQGWLVERTGSDHYRATSGPHIVILPATPSDSRALKNARAELRRKGANI